VSKSGVTIVLHHGVLTIADSDVSLLEGLTHGTDDRRGRHLSGPVTRGWALLNSRPGRSAAQLVDVLHVSLEMRFLFELLGAEVALVLVLALAVHAVHVPAEAALPLELLEADVAVVAGSLMLGLIVHVTTAGGSASKKQFYSYLIA
jgi:hypothetical protein